MASKFLAFAMLFLSGCGAVTSKSTFFPEQGQVGKMLGELYSHSNAQHSADKMVVVDDSTQSLMQLQLSPLAVTYKTANTLGAKSVLINDTGSYFIAISNKGYQIVVPNQPRHEKLMVGEILSAAYDPVQDLLIVEDVHRALSISQLSDDGKVTANWIGGPAIEGGSAFVNAGCLLPEAKLATSLGEGKLAIADLNASIVQQQWVYEIQTLPETKSMGWLSAIPGAPELILIGDEDQLITYNFQTKTIVSRLDLQDYSMLGISYDAIPHIVSVKKDDVLSYRDDKDSTVPISIFYSDTAGAVVEKKLSVEAQYLVRSWLIQNELVLVGCYSSCDSDSKYFRGRAYRFRTTDSLLIGKYENSRDALWNYAGGKILLQYPSALGYIELRDLSGPSATLENTLAGFNTKELQRR